MGDCRPDSLPFCKGFNGAALVRARKCADRTRQLGDSAVASMGPRSCERGNAIDRMQEFEKLYGFNGAALVRARKSASLAALKMD